MTRWFWRLVDYWLFPQERPGNKQIQEAPVPGASGTAIHLNETEGRDAAR